MVEIECEFKSQKGRICNAEQLHALNGNPMHLSKSGYRYDTSRTRIVRPSSLKRERETIAAENC